MVQLQENCRYGFSVFSVKQRYHLGVGGAGVLRFEGRGIVKRPEERGH